MCTDPNQKMSSISDSNILRIREGFVVVVVVVYSEFSVLLWSKALVLDLDQAEQYSYKYLLCVTLFVCLSVCRSVNFALIEM